MSRVSRGFRITGKIIKLIFFMMVFSVCGILLWRIFSSGDPASMKALTPNDRLLGAYELYGDDMRLIRQEQRTITSAESNYGYFSVTECVFLPESNQVQIVVRYNSSTIRSLQEDFSLAELPDRSEELFDVTLVCATDLTPDVSEDNYGNDSESVKMTRIHPVESLTASDTKNLYNYRRFVFDLEGSGIDLSSMTEDDLLLAVYCDIYYNGHIRYDEPAYGTLCLYDFESEIKEGRLHHRDEKALKAYAEGRS